MKTISLYYNNKKSPIRREKTEGGDLMKHQIASMILLSMGEVEDVSKIRVIIEEVEE